MGSFSTEHWISAIPLVLMFLAIYAAVVSKFRRYGRSLVVKTFFHSASPRDDGAYVEIVGRQSGLLSWLLAWIRVAPTVTLRVHHTQVEYRVASLSGYERVVLPIESVATTSFGVKRPWWLALSCLLVFVAASVRAAMAENTALVIGLIVVGVIVSVLIFILKRERMLNFTDVTGEHYWLALKRSVIEGKEITEETLDEMARIILALVQLHKKPRP